MFQLGINLLILCDNLPLVKDLGVISPKPVNAFDIYQIIRLHPAKQLLVLRSVEILAGLLIPGLLEEGEGQGHPGSGVESQGMSACFYYGWVRV